MVGRTICLIVIFLLTGFYISEAADYYVAPDGSGNICSLTSPCSLNEALLKATGDGQDSVIHVAGGYYTNGGSYYSNDGNGSLTVEANDPSNPPILNGESLLIDNDFDNDNTGDAGQVITVRGLVFQNASGPYWGGGLLVKTGMANIVIENCTFRNNSPDGNGGGAAILSYGGEITITGNIFKNNTTLTSGTLGGGLYIVNETNQVVLTNNIFYNNSSYTGGGAYISARSGGVFVTNNTIYENTANYDGGGLLVSLYDDSAFATFTNNIIYGNTSGQGGDDLYVTSDGNNNNNGSQVTLQFNDMGVQSDFDTGQSEDLYITVTNRYHHYKNIKGDPGFVDPVGGDLHLNGSSRCIDAGTSPALLPSSDFEGDPRAIDGDGDGVAEVDIGADEVYTDRVFRGDFNGDGREDILTVNPDGGRGVVRESVISNGNWSGWHAHWAAWPSRFSDVYVGDFNGDGRDDILTVDPSGGAVLRESMVSGGHWSGWHNHWAAWARGYWNVYVGDFNGDGADDILTIQGNLPFSWKVVLRESVVSGGHWSGWHNHWAVWPISYLWVYVGDFNGDGRDDLLTVNPSGGAVIRESMVSGGHWSGWHNHWAAWPSDYNQVYVGDFNGDGTHDIVTAKNSYGGLLPLPLKRVVIRESTVSGGHWSAWHNHLTSWLLNYSIIYVGDYNGDGRMDILSKNPIDGAVMRQTKVTGTHWSGWRNTWAAW